MRLYFTTLSKYAIFTLNKDVVLLMNIILDYEKIAEFCERSHICTLSVFGPVLRDDFGSDSDVDILVEFEEGNESGLMDFSGTELELSEIVKRKVIYPFLKI